MNIDWDKQPAEFPLWLEGTNEEHRKHSGWYRDAGQVFEGAHGGQWRAVREGQFFTVHHKPESTAWTGEGLPPVGTVCEFVGPCDVIMDSGAWKKELKIGSRVEIIYHYETGVALVAVFKFEVDFGHMVEQATAGCFRPMRTPEQIAEEAEVKELEALQRELEHWALITFNLGPKELAEKLMKSGYRKQVQP